MLTRLKVTGFKNLVDVDIRFGPFTCVAGSNGVGKSNLFDAIGFLSALAEKPFVEAARSIRDGKTLDVANLFHRVGSHHDETMTFLAEMIIPAQGTDDLGQAVEASSTFLRYFLELSFQPMAGSTLHGSIILRQELLEQLPRSEVDQSLLFLPSKEWRKSAVKGSRTKPFISTKYHIQGLENEYPIVHLHQDRGEGGGRTTTVNAARLTRTVLSSVNTAEYRTAVLARREMQSWRRLQLEPTALREPDAFHSVPGIGSDGSHLAITLHHLAHGLIPSAPGSTSATAESPDPEKTYTRVANRLAELIDDIREVGVDEDQQRELWTLFARGKNGTKHPARSLSDGTLRFLALAVIEENLTAQGVLCLEEPENGIHPARIPAMLRLLKDIAVDADLPIGPDNPLRQVIINTHSSAVVDLVSQDSLVLARLTETVRDGERFPRVQFLGLPNSWRTTGDNPSADVFSFGDFLIYLEGPGQTLSLDYEDEATHPGAIPTRTARNLRLRESHQMQKILNFGDDSE